MEAPQYPAGPLQEEQEYDARRREELIGVLERAPALLRQAVSDLSEGQLETRYRNWTIRQLVHHLADSHVHSYVRFKWALAEEHPAIKPYDEARWVALEDSRTGDVRAPLALLEGLHLRWVQLLRSMTDEHFARTFWHPETQKTVILRGILPYYAWHCRHHTGQILWLRQQHGWWSSAAQSRHCAMKMFLTSVYNARACIPSSRPNPLIL